jgi:hypothetical protein
VTVSCSCKLNSCGTTVGSPNSANVGPLQTRSWWPVGAWPHQLLAARSKLRIKVRKAAPYRETLGRQGLAVMSETPTHTAKKKGP